MQKVHNILLAVGLFVTRTHKESSIVWGHVLPTTCYPTPIKTFALHDSWQLTQS